MPEPILKLSGLRKKYQASAGANPVEVLKGIDLELSAGDSLAIVGPSGSGKSTMLNIIGALDRPDAGTVLLEGKDLGQLDEEQLARVRNESIGFIFQAHYLLPHCSVLENILVPTIVAKNADSKKSAHDRALKLLDRVGLGARGKHRPGELSGGERQRAAVVRALVNQPRLLLADEPTGALDHQSAENLGNLLVELNREEKVTLILVTHSLELARKMRLSREIVDGQLLPPRQ